MKAVVVTRVSTADQAEHGTSLAGQEERLTGYVASRGWTLVDVCADAGISGSTTDRPGLTRALQLIQAGQADVMVATKLDRVSRSVLGLLELVEDLTAAGASLVAVDDGLDTSTETGRLVAGILSIIAGFERDRIKARTTEGRARAAAAGRFVGATPPYGYRVVDHPSGTGKALAVDEREAQAVRYLYEQYVQAGRPAAATAAGLNEQGLTRRGDGDWTAQHVSQWATRRGSVETWAGVWSFGGQDVPIPAIITENEAARWSDWQAGRRWEKTRASRYALSGHLVMPCGGAANGRKAGNRAATYSCPGRLRGEPGHDDCVNMRADSTEEAVRSAIADQLTGPTSIARLRAAVGDRLASGDAGAELADLQRQAADLDEQIAQEMADLREAGVRRDAIKAALRPLVARQDDVAAKVRAAKRELARATSRGADIDAALSSASAVLSAPFETDRETWSAVLRALDVTVTVTGHATCTTCAGGGRMPATGQKGRGWTARCPICLRGTVPTLKIAMDDALALVIATAAAV